VGGGRGTSLDEPALVERVRAGDAAAFGLLYREYLGLVTFVVREHLQERQAVDDVVQEVFTRALERIGALREPDRFRHWLTRIARSVAIDHRRRAERIRTRTDAGTDPADEDVVVDARPTPDEVAELQELAQLVRGCIRSLRPRDATIVSMVAYLGFTPTEVGMAFGMTPTAAKVALHRSRSRLRTAILAEVLARRRVGGCPDLDISALIAGDVAALRHLSDCERCRGQAERQLRFDPDP
jgi:RNA polymerase sigma-70 factor (ECF subfamily)